MDVTEEILYNHRIYGASDNTAANRTAAGKSLNYAEGPSIQRPCEFELNAIPFTHKYSDAVGLFGAENLYIKYHVDILTTVLHAYTEPGWEASNVLIEETTGEGDWEQFNLVDVTFDEAYEDGVSGMHELPELNNMVVSIEIKNKGVNNIYIDDWLDVSLHTKDRQVHPYDLMYVRPHDEFYMSVHARNTKRLPYNIELVVGRVVLDKDELDLDQQRYLNTSVMR